MTTKTGTTLKGILFRKNIGVGKIVSITYPENYDDIYVVDANVLGENNYYDLEGSQFPVFASDSVLYPTQPLFAAFGQNKERIELFFRNVKIELSQEEISKDFQKKTFEWNISASDNIFKEENENYEKITSSFAIKRHIENLSSERKVSTVFEDGILSVDLETIWPNHVKKTLSSVFHLSPERIRVISQEARTDFDQLAIKPLVEVIPAAYIAIKNDCAVEISEDITSSHPAMNFLIESVVDKTTSEIIATKTNVSVDMGLVFIFEEEMATSLYAGLTNFYKNSVNEVKIELYTSNNPPSNFYRGLGYAPSVAAMERHASQIANTLNIQTHIWKTNNYDFSDEAQYHDVFNVGSIKLLEKTVSEVAENSDFARKNAVYNQKQISGRINPSLNYTRGIGLASAGGVSGFSSIFAKNKDYTISAVLNEDNSFVFNCGLYSNEDIKTFWKGIIKETFPEIPLRNIIIKSSSDEVQDSGPSVLSRTTSFVAKLLNNFCHEIEEKRENNAPYPISASFRTIENITTQQLYEVDSFGTVAIDLFIDPVRLNPVIYKVDAGFALGQNGNKEQVKKKLRQIISNTITDICPDATIDYSLSLTLSEDEKLSQGASISLARGITMAALSVALSQALRHSIYKLPILSEDILSIIKQKEST